MRTRRLVLLVLVVTCLIFQTFLIPGRVVGQSQNVVVTFDGGGYQSYDPPNWGGFESDGVWVRPPHGETHVNVYIYNVDITSVCFSTYQNFDVWSTLGVQIVAYRTNGDSFLLVGNPLSFNFYYYINYYTWTNHCWNGFLEDISYISFGMASDRDASSFADNLTVYWAIPPTPTSPPPTFTITPTPSLTPRLNDWMPTAQLPFCPPTATPGGTATQFAPVQTLAVAQFPTANFWTSTSTLQPTPAPGSPTWTPSPSMTPILTLQVATATPTVAITATRSPTYTPSPSPTWACRPGRVEISQPVVDFSSFTVDETSEPACATFVPRIDQHISAINLVIFTTPEIDIDIRRLDVCIQNLSWNMSVLGIDLQPAISAMLALVAIRMIVSAIRGEL